MFLFNHKKRDREARKEKEIASLHAEMLRKNEEAKIEIDKVDKFLAQHDEDDIAAIIFAATGGLRRERK